jgi:hypothetical protein
MNSDLTDRFVHAAGFAAIAIIILLRKRNGLPAF